jgi:MFS family permease
VIKSLTLQSWRWVFWILTLFAGACLLVIIFVVPETYAPAILTAKAVRMRKETGDDRYYAPRKLHLPFALSAQVTRD